MTDVHRTELTPLSFLERSAIAYPDKTAIVYGHREISYGEILVVDRHRGGDAPQCGSVCELQPGVEEMEVAERARFLARQGVSYLIADPTRVVDETMSDVSRDATEEAFCGGYFHSGDVAVWHPDNYIDLRDRYKDIIVSGGENISPIEVERAVVALPHAKWGERPKGFVVLKPGAGTTPGEIIEHVRSNLARFKAPDEIEIVDQLPETSTGKVQKYVLREKEWSGHERRIH